VKYTIVAVYIEDNEAVVEHVNAVAVSDALIAFYGDPESKESRRNGCKVVSVFEGHLFDQIADCPKINTDDLLTYEDHVKPLEK
jgi:hypothetical protein